MAAAWWRLESESIVQSWLMYFHEYSRHGYVFPGNNEWLRTKDDDDGDAVKVVYKDVEGLVPRWLLDRGCKGPYYVPVVLSDRPLTVNLTVVSPLTLWPMGPDAPSPSNVLAYVMTGKDALGMQLTIRGRKHWDDFDWDLPPQEHTSALLNRMRFPMPKVTPPQTMSHLPGFAPEEWVRFDLESYADISKEFKTEHHWWHSEDMSAKHYWHGAPWGAVVGMIAAGGFIPGPGTCRKNTRKVTGCFCSASFEEAFSKGANHQLDFAEGQPDGDKALNIFCMPCVVEIWPIDLRRPTHMHGSN